MLHAYGTLLAGAFGGGFNIAETLVKAAPMILTGLAVAVAFRARFWNIGAEGQLVAGAVASAYRGLVPDAGSARDRGDARGRRLGRGGAGAGAGVLRVRFRVDDAVSSLLLNSIVSYAVQALIEGPWKDPLSGYPISPPIEDSANFPVLLEGTRLHLGVLVAVLDGTRDLVPDGPHHARLRRSAPPARTRRRPPMPASRPGGSSSPPPPSRARSPGWRGPARSAACTTR